MSENSERRVSKQELRNRLRQAHLNLQEAIEQLHQLKFIVSRIQRFEPIGRSVRIDFSGMGTHFNRLLKCFENRLEAIEARSSELGQKLTREATPFEVGKQS